MVTLPSHASEKTRSQLMNEGKKRANCTTMKKAFLKETFELGSSHGRDKAKEASDRKIKFSFL